VVEDSTDVIRNLSRKLQEAHVHDLAKKDSASAETKIAQMTQIQFIQLLKCFYEFVGTDDDRLCHALLCAGTLLFKLGETQKFYLRQVESDITAAMASDVPTTSSNTSPLLPSKTERIGDLTACLNDNEWYVNVEQIIATVLAEPSLHEFFDVRYSLKEMRDRSLNK
jgi:hypothetical protein